LNTGNTSTASTPATLLPQAQRLENSSCWKMNLQDMGLLYAFLMQREAERAAPRICAHPQGCAEVVHEGEQFCGLHALENLLRQNLLAIALDNSAIQRLSQAIAANAPNINGLVAASTPSSTQTLVSGVPSLEMPSHLYRSKPLEQLEGQQNTVCHVKSDLCTVEGCTKFSRGNARLCIKHGGGKRCAHEGCQKSGLGKSGFCIAHGGGKRCMSKDCTKSAIGRSDYCIKHGGGKRCGHEDCPKVAQGRTGYCIAHGGGRRCGHEGCIKSTQGTTGFCRSHRLEDS